MSPRTAPTAFLLSLGEELLEGRVQDRNASTFAQELLHRGFHVVGMRTLGDAPGELSEALGALQGKVDLILSTGGLGPTVDDRVRAESAAFVGAPLQKISAEAIASLDAIYRRHRQDTPPPFFLAQGCIPQGALPLANAAGTAWGFLLELAGGTRYAALPGPPRECASAFHQGGLAAFLQEQYSRGAEALAYGLLHTVGAPESLVEERIRDLLEAGGNPRLGITAGADKVSVSVLARAEADIAAEAVCKATLTLLKQRLGELVFGEGEQTLAAAVLAALEPTRQQLVVAESCTGGQLAAAITAVPGASRSFYGGFLTYANEAKVQQLGVPAALLETHGAVSAEVAAAMARGAQARSACAWAIATTGIAGPGGGSPEKPVGTVWIALAGPEGLLQTVHRRQYARGGRAIIQELTVRDALDLLRRALAGLPPLPSTS